MMGEGSSNNNINKEYGLGVSRGISIIDIVLRIIAMLGTFGSAVAMGTTEETLPSSNFSTQAAAGVLFQAQYDDIPTFRFFVIANAVVCGYLAFSLPLSIYHIVMIRTSKKSANTRALLIFLDTIMLGVVSAGASAAAAIVYIAHKGNSSANWVAICQQYQEFCEKITGSLIGSFAAALIFVLLIPLSALVLSRHHH
ncbi:hypothetical protein ACJIZ3_019986 [Penstemon smallii]|uniref:CASP-like protein n=1 Tax=Penstemon smallii TaxID=265156 RepID=A0ABD3SI22_9LAMI